MRISDLSLSYNKKTKLQKSKEGCVIQIKTMICKVIKMRMLIALMILIALTTSAQACWPPANPSENSGNDAEPVKVVEPVEDEQDNATSEEQGSDGSNDTDGSEEVEVVAPVVDTVDQAVTEEPEVVETPTSETVTESEPHRSSGYGEARILEISATAVQPKDAGSRPINNEPVSVTSGTNVTVEQITEVNTDGNADNNNSSYVAGAALALVAMIAGAVYYFRK